MITKNWFLKEKNWSIFIFIFLGSLSFVSVLTIFSAVMKFCLCHYNLETFKKTNIGGFTPQKQGVEGGRRSKGRGELFCMKLFRGSCLSPIHSDTLSFTQNSLTECYIVFLLISISTPSPFSQGSNFSMWKKSG